MLKVPLYEIDPDIIPNVRPLSDENSEAYKNLLNCIDSDSQRHPITVRKLTDEELQKTKISTAIYGIIDGHHRFRIAEELNQTKILAEIDDGEASFEHDVILAMRLNISPIKMSLKDKGKIICELCQYVNTHYDEPNKTNVVEVGERIFGLKKSMTYKCVNAYKRANNEKVIQKPRTEVSLKLQDLSQNLNFLQNILGSEEGMQTIADDSAKTDEILKKIYEVEKQLKNVKKLLRME